MPIKPLSSDEIAHIVNLIGYDPAEGRFWWKCKSSRKIMVGAEAGHIQAFVRKRKTTFYRVIRVRHRLFLAHRIAWLIENGNLPECRIDHIDGNTLNNKIDNFRLASNRQNLQNSQRRCDNKSGYKGVSWDRINSKWVVRIRAPDGSYKNLGRFDCAEIAHRAYCAEATKLFGEFARAA
jgi:hypothetical protein